MTFPQMKCTYLLSYLLFDYLTLLIHWLPHIATPPLPILPSYLYKTLSLNPSLLNQSNPILAKDCWLCISLSTTTCVATPVPSKDWVLTKLTYHPRYEGKSPLQLLDMQSLAKFSVIDMTKNTLTGRIVQLLRSYISSLTQYTSNGKPIHGPVTTDASLTFQAPVCVQCNLPSGLPLGHLLFHQCTIPYSFKPQTTTKILRSPKRPNLNNSSTFQDPLKSPPALY